MLGQLSRKDQPDSSLDLSRCDSGLLVVASQLGSLGGDLVENVIDEGVQDGHGLGADACVWVHLRQGKETKTSVVSKSHFVDQEAGCTNFSIAKKDSDD